MKTDRRGLFISLEGSEGAGKSVAAKWLADQLRVAGETVCSTREPGGTPLAEAVRELLISDWQEPVDPLTEALLVFAARRQHVEQVIGPALARGETVICDRFTDATRAYQGSGRGLDRGLIDQLARWSHPTCNPDVTLFFDVPAATGIARAAGAGELDRFERESREFFEQVVDGYRELARAAPERWIVVDAAATMAEVQQQLADVLKAIAGQTKGGQR